MVDITSSSPWKTLQKHYLQIGKFSITHWFKNDSLRAHNYSINTPHITLDYSRNRINEQTLPLFFTLAQHQQLKNKIQALFNGEIINSVENKPALHTALRQTSNRPIYVNNVNIIDDIHATQQRLYQFTDAIHSGKWLGCTGKAIQSVVNIGIGGSHVGPQMAVQALKDYAISNLKFFFLSSIDPAHLYDLLSEINLETTLFIISSKSFSTHETLTNARTIIQLLTSCFGDQAITHHIIATTSAHEKARALNIPLSNIFSIWDWVGGRYSIWSAIGLPLLLLIGQKQFTCFLEGAYQMDQHFLLSEFENNMPVILACLSIWYANFFNAQAEAIIPYSYRLRGLIDYLQQAEMESNGKSVNLAGQKIQYTTSPVIFGQEGSLGQHAYHQLLHQGQPLVPASFIVVKQSTIQSLPNHESVTTRQTMLLANALSQAHALMQGRSYDEALEASKRITNHSLSTEQLAAHLTITGNKPSNLLILEALNPSSLGALLALYEHKIFTQGVLWDINPFDQWGVELGKSLYNTIFSTLRTEEMISDPS